MGMNVREAHFVLVLGYVSPFFREEGRVFY